MLKRNIFYITIVLATFIACNQTPREMPITTSSDEAREAFIKGRDFWESGVPSKADSCFNRAMELDSNFALATLMRFNQGGIYRAMDLINNASHSESLFIRAYSDFINGEYKSGIKYLDSLLELHPRDKHLLFFAGISNRDEEKALKYYKKALKVDKFFAAPYNGIGQTQLWLDNFGEAERALQKYFDLNPTSSSINRIYADLKLRMGEPDKALKHYQNALLDDPSIIRYYNFITLIYVHQQKNDKALDFCKSLYNSSEILKYDPDSTSYYWYYSLEATINFINNNPEASFDILDRRLEFSKKRNNQFGIYFSIILKSWYAIISGSPGMAVDILTSALNDIENKDSLLWLDKFGKQHFHGTLSIAYQDLGDNIKSLNHLSEARRIYNDKRNIMFDNDFMRVYESIYAINSGDYETAIKLLHIAADRASVTSQYYLGLAYDLSGNPQKAIKYYKLAYYNLNENFPGLFFNKSKQRIEELENDK